MRPRLFMFYPEGLHDEIQYMRLREVQEIERQSVLVAPVLQLRVCFRVGRYKRRRGDATHALTELLVIEQLGTRFAHQLDADGNTPSLTQSRMPITFSKRLMTAGRIN